MATCFVRVLMRSRRAFIDNWAAKHTLPEIACGKHRDTIDAAWRTSVATEICHSSGQCCAQVIWDKYKFFTCLLHHILIERGRRHDFPLPLLRLAIDGYR